MSNNIFMALPFSDPIAADAYRYSTKPVAEAHGFAIQRADEIFTTNPILDDIFTAIEQASLVIVDISGSNANCFYELGVSHSLKRSRTIMITHDDFKDIPFDIAHFRVLRYQDSIQGKASYEAELGKTLKSITENLIEFYRGEFDIIVDLLTAMDSTSIHACQALALASTKIHRGDEISTDGRDPQGLESGSTGMADTVFEPFIARKIVRILDDSFSLTSKGTAFVDFVKARGFVLDSFNDEHFTEHESEWERAARNHLLSKPLDDA